ncbi:siderophore biosynthetic enzyme [Arenicella chitinivorans]|uniref:Siderophore biosynthetic enzyme n=1 Tax=Arenicella chitinivorans TaxID=1329800 RepID=A0A918RGB4_9GAMM|nr:GNAT family N-acetyltransferase [Arenicella chitinivorans]GGZ97755.1 siderophore biosynthetic enzyme [Arenicella chitinivorans]
MFVYQKSVPELGQFSLRPYCNTADATLIHAWVNAAHAKFWMLQNTSVEQVAMEYEKILATQNTQVFIGCFDQVPVFLFEFYNAELDDVAEYYEAQQGDYGMHILVAPTQTPLPKFTWHVFKFILEFIFSHAQVQRVVVEPDADNSKIHALNLKAGFCYQGVVEMPTKRAQLAFCSRDDFRSAVAEEAKS